ncbi:MAG TPA: S8 family peptidase, partial [Longimicrobiaceae bacterium]|nr:S8 family peptidase [Longimicrobiaceae bacterium]
LALPLALAACTGDATAPELRDPSERRTATAAGAADYIVVLKEGADPRAVAALTGVRPSRVYEHALRGFAARLDARALTALRHLPSVAYVEADAPAQLFTTQLFPNWGVDRVDQRNLPLSNSFTYFKDGTGIIIWVLDTGIRKTHAQFSGRAGYIANGFMGDFVGDGWGSINGANDCHGHGTHVASIAAGIGYGIAKNAQIRAGRVVDCGGNGSAAMVISAMDWIVAHATAPGVVNMSLGYGDEQSVRDAAARLYQDGHVVVAAAGNGDFAGNPQNACQQSPGGYSNALTVGATTSADHEASFSNYGTCVDLLAPGVSVAAAGIANDTSRVSFTGTSAAAPFVAGVAAQYLSAAPAALPSVVNNAIKNNVTTGVLTMNNPFSLTPNKLLYTNY